MTAQAKIIAILLALLLAAASCKKKDHFYNPAGGTSTDAPRTSPMRSELVGDWQVSTSGAGYLYNGYSYGNSGHGFELNIKGDGTGWLNAIDMLSTPNCLLTLNLSVDCTFEYRPESGTPMLWAYYINGTHDVEECTSHSHQELSGDKVYPAKAPNKYYYQLATADNDLSIRLLLLSTEEDASIRFAPDEDVSLKVLRKL